MRGQHTWERVERILEEVKCPGWALTAFLRDDEVFIQGQLETDDGEWTTRKWFISRHATDSEIIQTALKLCLTSAEHQVRERFTWRGRLVFGPHMDVDRLWDAALPGHEDKRG